MTLEHPDHQDFPHTHIVYGVAARHAGGRVVTHGLFATRDLAEDHANTLTTPDVDGYVIELVAAGDGYPPV